MTRTNFTKPTRRDAFARAAGHCEAARVNAAYPGLLPDCKAKLQRGRFRYDHIVPDWIGGPASLENCAVLCDCCDKIKTGTRDIPAIAKTKRLQDAEMGIKSPTKKIQSAGFRKRPSNVKQLREDFPA
jgi:5-methylcytosine-specific restriction protein A